MVDWSAIALSLRLATLTTLILLIGGLPLAGWLALSHRRGRWAVRDADPGRERGVASK